MSSVTYPDNRVMSSNNLSQDTYTLSASAVSWGAIFAGALAAAALSFVLFVLGSGLGLSSISVWSDRGADGGTIGWAAIFWLAFIQLASAGIGGYIAGRLRTKWAGIHSDEVYFRDTAHGFLAWALATMVMVVVMGSMLGSAVSGASKTIGVAASGAAQVAGGVANAVGGTASAAISGAAGAATSQLADRSDSNDSGLGYWIDSLLRKTPTTQSQQNELKNDLNSSVETVKSTTQDARTIATIFTHSLKTGKMSDEDISYVSAIVAQNSNLSNEEAKRKVEESFASIQKQIDSIKQKTKEAEEKAKESAEKARKATAYSLLWAFVALLFGAFVGSICATIGGRQRDAI